WYYFTSSGKMVTGWQEIGGKWYYFASSGKMAVGLQEIGGKWYYFASSGKMAVGWQEIGGKWYYFASSGKMMTGWQEISGKWYYFASSGKMSVGWQQIGSKWYYFTSSGAMKTGWLEDDGYRYYLKSDGSMAVSEKIGTDLFNSLGHWYRKVSPGASVTYDNVVNVLEQYDPDGAYIIRHTSEDETLYWLEGSSTIRGALGDFGIMVHEQCHEYNNYRLAPKYPVRGLANLGYEERIYLGGGKSVLVMMTLVYDSIEMADSVPESLRGNRFDGYITTPESSMTSRHWGIYGLLDEYSAYCWGMNAGNMMEQYKVDNGISRGNVSDEYLSYAEFRFYILKYPLYARENYPEIYKGILENDNFRRAFTTVDTKFASVVATYFKNHPNRIKKWEDQYKVLTAEVEKKEYQDLLELLKP
ncbi:MAG: N-acetylmuramoyl-L-alanine amidase family protein, partial [Lachnospiraceae bacterium]|nr:N-acetylmuramoyl-L-alanine amidase family protein [Lachnospiraceae bacterium]